MSESSVGLHQLVRVLRQSETDLPSLVWAQPMMWFLFLAWVARCSWQPSSGNYEYPTFPTTPSPSALGKHCKYKTGSFVGHVSPLSHLGPPPPLCVRAFSLHSSCMGLVCSLTAHSGSVGATGRILGWSQDSCSLVFALFTRLIRLHGVTKVKRFCSVVKASDQLILRSSKGRLSRLSLS